MSRKRIGLILLLVIFIFAMFGCSKPDNSITVNFDPNKSCEKTNYTATGGSIEINFKNTGSKSGSILLTQNKKIILTAKNISSKKEKTIKANLNEGTYLIQCGSEDAIQSVLAVSSVVELSENENKTYDKSKVEDEINQSVKEYKTYVLEQVQKIKAEVKLLTDPVRAGDLELAKTNYPLSRQAWESIEPIAQLFPKEDFAIDSRADDHADLEADGFGVGTFKGYHQIEYLLFIQNNTQDAIVYADELEVDIDKLQAKIESLTIDPFIMSKGPQGLIEEVATTKIRGEENRYSGTDLYDFEANLEGSDVIIDFFADELNTQEPAFMPEYEESMKYVRSILNKYKTPNGAFENYSSLTQADKDELKVALDNLTEQLSQISGYLGLG